MTTATYIMNRSASLLNDTTKTIYAYQYQIPYLNTAIQELREELELNNVGYSNATNSDPIELLAGVDNIGGDGPPLPVGLIEIQQIWQRWGSSGNNWFPITKYEFLPHFMENDNQETSTIPAWSWEEQIIKFIPSNTDLEIKIDYIKNNLPDVIDENTILTLINCENVLSFRNAALCARFIGENPTRADSLDIMAGLALSRFLGINTKGRQSIRTRRRPFNAAYKSLRWGW